jgi:hypothetical protein
MIVKTYTVELQTYHDEIVGRLIYKRADGSTDESTLYSLGELNNIVALWRADALMGSFAIGATLALDAECIIQSKGRA